MRQSPYAGAGKFQLKIFYVRLPRKKTPIKIQTIPNRKIENFWISEKNLSVLFQGSITRKVNDKEAVMKCYTVTHNGVIRGIKFFRTPYPHVAVGDPTLSSADCRRVEVDKELAESATNDSIIACSYVPDVKQGEMRRSSFKLIAPTGIDDDQALVKLEARCASPGNRTFYDLPLYTFALANGWYLADGTGPQVSTPVNLIVLDQGDDVKIYRTVDIWKQPELVFAVAFDGAELRQTGNQRAAA
jgi:hypothetical protein